MTPLLQVEHLSRSFGRPGWFSRRAPVRAVDDVSFTIGRGETLGLVGESGCGKSTLGRLVLRLIEPDSGKVMLDGDDVTALPTARLRQLRRKMQIVFQDPYGSLDPRMSAGAIIDEPMRVHGVLRAERGTRTLQTLRHVGLDPSHAERYPHQFSGGQRQRIGIARAMALSPKLLVLDEPVSALDVSIQAQIINLLQQLQRDTDLSFLFIAHDLAVVRHISHRVAVMYLGRIVEIGPREQLYTSPLHPYTVTLLSAVPLPDPDVERTRVRIAPHGEIGSAANLPTGCRFHPRCYRARQIANERGVETVTQGDAVLPLPCVQQMPAPVEIGGGHSCACHYPELPETRSPAATRVLDNPTRLTGASVNLPMPPGATTKPTPRGPVQRATIRSFTRPIIARSHPRWVFHFTPTSASWPTPSKASSQPPPAGASDALSSNPSPNLEDAIPPYIREHNRSAKPFVWTKPADAIFSKLTRLPAPSQ